MFISFLKKNSHSADGCFSANFMNERVPHRVQKFETAKTKINKNNRTHSLQGQRFFYFRPVHANEQSAYRSGI